MPIPSGTYAINGPILDISGGLLTPSTTLRDAGVVTVRAGKIRRVNSVGDGWEDVPGHVIAATEPAARFEGLLWYDTSLNILKHYNGTSFVAVAGSSAAIDDLSVTTAKLAANAVTAAKLADSSVDVGALIDLSVTTDKLGADSVTKEKIADNAVEAAAIKDRRRGNRCSR